MNCLKTLGRLRRLIMDRSLSTVAQAIDPVQEASLKEMCILVDRNDTAIGSASKRDCHRVGPGEDIPLHRAFSVFLFNSKKELLLQRRSASKITFPGFFTNTCCSHPLYEASERDETDALGVKLAARRRLYYELGIPPDQISPEEFTYLTRIIYKSTGDGVWGEHEVDYILFLQKDVRLDPNPEEVSEICYVPRDKLKEFLDNLKVPITPWFDLIVTHRLEQWWDNLDRLEAFQDHRTIHTLKS